MPVEIKELIIRMEIKEDSAEQPEKSEDITGSIEREEIISACVEQVLKILERQRER